MADDLAPDPLDVLADAMDRAAAAVRARPQADADRAFVDAVASGAIAEAATYAHAATLDGRSSAADDALVALLGKVAAGADHQRQGPEFVQRDGDAPLGTAVTFTLRDAPDTYTGRVIEYAGVDEPRDYIVLCDDGGLRLALRDLIAS